jgi:hypothetical protein
MALVGHDHPTPGKSVALWLYGFSVMTIRALAKRVALWLYGFSVMTIRARPNAWLYGFKMALVS